MNYRHRNPGDTLVQLSLLKSFDLDPPPDKALRGRLDQVLRSVGANGAISVRARMITAISNTKFKTVDGDPVSLVGLHGKDELLVRGPAWAIERLGQGETPDPTECASWLQKQFAAVTNEAGLLAAARTVVSFYMKNLPKLTKLESRPELQLRRDSWSGESKPAYLSDRQFGASDIKRLTKDFELLESLRPTIKECAAWLGRFFGVDASLVVQHFSKQKGDGFFDLMETELTALTARIQCEHQRAAEGKMPWWFAWTTAWEEMQQALMLTESDRHFTKYRVGNPSDKDLRSPRNSYYGNWTLPKNLG